MLVGNDTTPADGDTVAITLPDEDGDYTLYSRATDSAANAEAAPASASADQQQFLDRVTPASAVTSAARYTNQRANTVTYSLSHASPSSGFSGSAAKVEIYATKGTTTTLVGTDTTPADGDTVAITLPDEDGDYTLYSRATDSAANTEAAPASASADQQQFLDRAAGNSTITFPANNGNYNAEGFKDGCLTPTQGDVCGTASDNAGGAGL